MKQSLFIPLLDRVLVQPDPIEETTAAGIIMASTDTHASPISGFVVAKGPGRTENGILIPMTVKVTDVVMWSKFAGTKITVNGEELLLMRETDISGILRQTECDGETFAEKFADGAKEELDNGV